MQKQKFDEIVSYFNKKVSEMEIETKYKMELLGMVTALECAHEKETHDKRAETHACDLIDRQAAIETLNVGAELLKRVLDDADIVGAERAKYEWGLGLIESYISDMKDLPSAQPEPAIPLSWIEAQIEWLKSLDNDFSTLTAVQISAMVNKWKEEQDERYDL